MQILRDLGYVPALRSCMPRICPDGLQSSETWTVDLRDRMPIIDDREPVAAKTDAAGEVAAVRKDWFGGKI